MGRLLFGIVLAVIGLMYLAAAWMSVFTSAGFLANNLFGALLFLVVGVLAAGASVNLLREKRR